ncbi:EKC/KEOPS complex subunit Tprkb [Taenia solium]|eukprot:TsM_000667500 transcript=TsM_000667500 gene=TsM_000667500
MEDPPCTHQRSLSENPGMSKRIANKIKDPIQRESLARRLAQRNMCSVRLSNLPRRYNYSVLLELVPDMVACRMLYDPVFRRPKSRAYVEFSSNESALNCVDKVNNREFQGKRLSASVGGDLSESVARGSVGRRQSVVANLTFGTVEEAIAAVDGKQGCVIHGRRISVHFCPKKVKSKIVGLVVYGLKKSTTEDEVRVLFPQANKVEMYPLGGFAVLHYALVEDCKVDRENALGAKLKKRKLRIVFNFRGENHEKMRSNIITEAGENNPSSLIIVKNLGRSATEEQVSSLFAKAKIVSMPRKGKACRGYAILDFKSVMAAKRILAKSYVFKGRTLAWIDIDLKLFPGYKLSVALICDVSSPLELNGELQSGHLSLPPNLCALVDADYVVDIGQVEIAAVQALINRTGGRLQGKGVFSSEFLACLQPRHSIKEALVTFGVKKSTTRMLLVLLQTPGSSAPDFERVNSHISGKFADPLTLHKSCNREKISHIYGISSTEFKGFGNSERAYSCTLTCLKGAAFPVVMRALPGNPSYLMDQTGKCKINAVRDIGFSSTPPADNFHVFGNGATGVGADVLSRQFSPDAVLTEHLTSSLCYQLGCSAFALLQGRCKVIFGACR